MGLIGLVGALALLGIAGAGRAGTTAAVVAASVYAAVAFLVLRAIAGPDGPRRFGSANLVTLLRAGLAALVTGLALEALATGSGLLASPGEVGDPWAWAVPVGALLALILDGIDGWLARRGRLASAFGARFDMEADALLMLGLSLAVLAGGRTGPWVLLAGVLRYGFVAAGAIWPVLAAPLPPSFRRKALCVATGVALAVGLVPAVPPTVAGVLAGAGVLALVYSFAVDTVWLLRRQAATALTNT
ncbi:MAG TPA: CDP-alcohol phosphatidyltransferase family protein [Stellaceae bacterium]|nr:CDP-alcohol phosphatidyltransferase family protein [Stellaceae bacterium]